jgi:hypothetical protein
MMDDGLRLCESIDPIANLIRLPVHDRDETVAPWFGRWTVAVRTSQMAGRGRCAGG